MGKILNIYIKEQPGYSIGELYQGIKSGDNISFLGPHSHGGNGTYVDYSHAEYIPTNHKVMVRVLVECPYMEKGIKKIAKKKISLELCSFDKRLTTKQEEIYYLVGQISKDIPIQVNHIKNEKEYINKWELPDIWKKALIEFVPMLAKEFEDLTEKNMLDYEDKIISNYRKALKNSLEKAGVKL